MQKRFAFLMCTLSLPLDPLSPRRWASDKPAPQRCQRAMQVADGKSVKWITPAARQGRKIYGGLVPYGQVWRTGANEATTFVSDANLSIGGKDVPRGNTPCSRFRARTSGRW